jgi:shikimate dehydrogenase
MRLALLGDPVVQSRSPAIHQAALRSLRIEGSYEARRVDVEGLKQALAEVAVGALDGVNVTMPLKAAALAAVAGASTLATRAGAVNTVSRRDGVVFGDNTDVQGINDAWQNGGLPDDVPILVLGSGGAAAAALLALEGSDLLIASRRQGGGALLAARLGVEATEVSWGSTVDGSVVINATPLGMSGESLPDGVVEAAVGLFDMAYGASATPSVQRAGHRPVVDGIDMLVAQAARSFEIWTGLPAPFEVMAVAARL